MPGDQDAPVNWTDALPSIPQFFAVLSSVRACPGRMATAEEGFAVKVATLTIGVIIFALARGLIAGASQDIAPYILATIVSTTIVFVAGYGALIIRPGEEGQLLAGKWAAFFVYLWLTSLILVIVFDGLPMLLTASHTPASTWIIDRFATPGAFEEWQKNLARAVLFTLAGITLLLVQTKRADPDFSLSSGCWPMAAAIGLVVNAVLMLAFLYGNVV